MFDLATKRIDGLRARRWAQLAVANLRIFVGFAFVPAGLKKLLDQPFTAPDNTGLFHEFLHAFHATGAFYQLVGVLQLCCALLLMTQRFATVGALLALPIITAITAFCYSTQAGVPTLVVTSLLLLAIVGLLLWDHRKWRALLAADDRDHRVDVPRLAPLIDHRLWQRTGALVAGFYLFTCVLAGGIYRPRKPELDDPAFYVFPLMLLIPLGALFIDRARNRRRNSP